MKDNYILYTSSHIKVGAPIEKIPFKDAQSKLGFKYIDSSLKESFLSCTAIFPRINERFSLLANPESTLVVHEVAPQVGKGLTTRKPIPANKVIAEYVGQEIVRSNGLKVDGNYNLYAGFAKEHFTNYIANIDKAKKTEQPALWKKFAMFASSAFENDSKSCQLKMVLNHSFIDAQNEGNLSRFASHMSDDSVKHKGYDTAEANLDIHYLPSNQGKLKAFLVTKRDIEAHEEFAFDYGESFTQPVNQLLGMVGATSSTSNSVNQNTQMIYFDRKTQLPILGDGSLYNPFKPDASQSSALASVAPQMAVLDEPHKQKFSLCTKLTFAVGVLAAVISALSSVYQPSEGISR